MAMIIKARAVASCLMSSDGDDGVRGGELAAIEVAVWRDLPSHVTGAWRVHQCMAPGELMCSQQQTFAGQSGA